MLNTIQELCRVICNIHHISNAISHIIQYLETEVSYAQAFICNRLTPRENLYTSNKDK